MVTNYLRARLPGVDAAVMRWEVGGSTADVRLYKDLKTQIYIREIPETPDPPTGTADALGIFHIPQVRSAVNPRTIHAGLLYLCDFVS